MYIIIFFVFCLFIYLFNLRLPSFLCSVHLFYLFVCCVGFNFMIIVPFFFLSFASTKLSHFSLSLLWFFWFFWLVAFVHFLSGAL